MTNQAIPSILKKIVLTKEREVVAAKQTKDLPSIKEEALALYESQKVPRRGFAMALRLKQADGLVAIIAEIKKASPSKGVISQNFNPTKIAKQYEKAGAACLSVLTDEQYFQGHSQYLTEVKQSCNLPVLRKDFMIDAYQIYESYLMGADCILLIVACLNDEKLYDLHRIACQLGMDVLIEVHTQLEMQRALKLPKSKHNIYGINNRDLNTFDTNLNTSIKLKAFIDEHNHEKIEHPLSDDYLLVTESGIHNANDIALMQNNHINCFLIGEQFMKTERPGDTLKDLLNQID